LNKFELSAIARSTRKRKVVANSPRFAVSESTVDVVLTCGTFDLLHVGHISVLKRARALGRRLVVGVSSDELNLQKKGRLPVYSLQDRLTMLAELRCVDEVFVEESLEQKREYIERFGANLFVIGDDWTGKFDDSLAGVCKVKYLPRTPSISTTETIEVIRSSPHTSEVQS
jgi:glycerol-3-phosphate cytidylyltransferase